MRRKACRTHGSDVQYLQNVDRKNLKERDYLKGLGVDRRFVYINVERREYGEKPYEWLHQLWTGTTIWFWCTKQRLLSYKNHMEFLQFLSDY